jgi:hypothetical protein
MFNSNTWMILYYDTWLDISMPPAIKNKINKNKNIKLVGT